MAAFSVLVVLNVGVEFVRYEVFTFRGIALSIPISLLLLVVFSSLSLLLVSLSYQSFKEDKRDL